MKQIKRTEEEQLRGCLEDILMDMNENSPQGDIEYFLDCWKNIIEFALDYRSDAQ
tara:strand:+ start:718 stop:882 length:165 start_codon:yes stop_codon:yes gene_type:complete